MSTKIHQFPEPPGLLVPLFVDPVRMNIFPVVGASTANIVVTVPINKVPLREQVHGITANKAPEKLVQEEGNIWNEVFCHLSFK